jgi:hypothetical protein
VYVLRIPIIPSDYASEFQHLQFPVKLYFAVIMKFMVKLAHVR